MSSLENKVWSPIKNITMYCAGPVDFSNTRSRWGRFDWNMDSYCPELMSDDWWREAPKLLQEIPAKGMEAGYAGPYIGGSDDHGGAHSYPHALIPSSNATIGDDALPTWGQDTVIRDLAGIDAADVVVGWIPREGCHGTIAELGYAVSKGKKIILGFEHEMLMGSHWFLAFMVINSQTVAYEPVIVIDSPEQLLVYVDQCLNPTYKEPSFNRFAPLFAGWNGPDFWAVKAEKGDEASVDDYVRVSVSNRKLLAKAAAKVRG